MRILLLALAALANPCWSEETAQFLKLGVGARAVGLGGAYTAMAEDASAMYWNPAGLAGLRQSEVGLTHAQLSQDTRHDYLGLAQPFKSGTIGLSATHLSQGSVQGRDENGRLTSDFKAQDTAISLGYAGTMSLIRLGAAVKYVRSAIADASAQSVALDLGGLYALAALGPGTPRIGFAIQNLGPGMRFLDRRSNLPLSVSLGAGYVLPAGLTLAADIKHSPYAGATQVSVGTEYAIIPALAVRAGYATNHGAMTNAGKTDFLAGFGAGFGVRFKAWSLDYSMTPLGALGNAQRLSLGARFGQASLPRQIESPEFHWPQQP